MCACGEGGGRYESEGEVKYKEEEEQQQQQEQEQQGSVANTAEEGLRAQEVRAIQKKARVLLERSNRRRRRREAKQRFQQNCTAIARTPASVDLTESEGGAKVR